MNGYVKNKLGYWAHAMKRSIAPGEKIPLGSLYEQYGEKHDLAEGEEFVKWLREVKLRNEDKWEIVLEATEEAVKEPKEEEKLKEEKKPREEVEGPQEVMEEDKRGHIKDMTVRDVSTLSVRKAREVLPRIMDLNLLKYALQEANQLAGKDTLCRMLRKRIDELQISR